SYISSAGYMFVLFWATLAMFRLRKMYPNIERPFKAPFFPLTAYIAAASGILIIAFASKTALKFLGIVLLSLSVIYFISKAFNKRKENRTRIEEEVGGGRILVVTVNPKTAIGLVKIASRIAEHQEDTSICLFNVIKAARGVSQENMSTLISQKNAFQNDLLKKTAEIAQARNVPIYTKHKIAPNVETGIFNELKSSNPVQLVLFGWPSTDTKIKVPHNIIKEVLIMAHKNVGVLRDHGLNGLQNILVPIGNGPNARLALKLASDIAFQQNVNVTAIRILPQKASKETQEDELSQMQEIAESEIGSIPPYMEMRTILSNNVLDGIVGETEKKQYDLMIIGAAEEVYSPDYIFGKLNDVLVEEVSCSVLIVRRYQPHTAIWFRQQIKLIEE
ncbi:MAG: Cationic amino acid transporter, partial [Anaerolinea thermophila]